MTSPTWHDTVIVVPWPTGNSVSVFSPLQSSGRPLHPEISSIVRNKTFVESWRIAKGLQYHFHLNNWQSGIICKVLLTIWERSIEIRCSVSNIRRSRTVRELCVHWISWPHVPTLLQGRLCEVKVVYLYSITKEFQPVVSFTDRPDSVFSTSRQGKRDTFNGSFTATNSVHGWVTKLYSYRRTR